MASGLFLNYTDLTIKHIRRCLDALAKQEVEATFLKNKHLVAFRILLIQAGEGNSK